MSLANCLLVVQLILIKETTTPSTTIGNLSLANAITLYSYAVR